MNIRITIAVAASFMLLSACEDLPTGTYIPQTIVEGVLYVDEPIRRIKVQISQPTTDTFRLKDGFVRDANVRIFSQGQTYELKYRDLDSTGEYYYPDTTVMVQPGQNYRLEVVTGGKTFVSETTTPGRIEWVREPRGVVQFPPIKDLVVPNDTLQISWTKASDLDEYYISVRCLDTLHYGKYLNPPREEKNMRVDVGVPVRDRFEKETSRYAYVGAIHTVAPVWIAFKWYGMQEISVYAPDVNWLNWMKLTRLFGGGTYNENLGSMYEVMPDGTQVKAFGVFGSVSAARKKILLLKPER